MLHPIEIIKQSTTDGSAADALVILISDGDVGVNRVGDADKSSLESGMLLTAPLESGCQ